jgi:hypothetical protein
MSRLAHAWRGTRAEQRLAAVAAVALLITMFFPWYGLQNLNRKSGAIYSHDINAFGDVSFVEAAIFLVALGVLALVLARGEGREFRLPGGDGTIVLAAGGWATLLIFYRVFDRPAGNGYPVGIEWGFFLAFVASGALAYAGWRMRACERPPPPLTRSRAARRRPPREAAPPGDGPADTDPTIVAARGMAPRAGGRAAPVAARERPRFPPAPEQLSFEDPPAGAE